MPNPIRIQTTIDPDRLTLEAYCPDSQDYEQAAEIVTIGERDHETFRAEFREGLPLESEFFGELCLRAAKHYLDHRSRMLRARPVQAGHTLSMF